MTSQPGGSGRPSNNWKRTLEREIARHQRRKSQPGNFWRYLNLIGAVGWPIALASVGGVLAGRSLDTVLNAGIRFSVLFLTLGIALGSWIAWRTVSRNGA